MIRRVWAVPGALALVALVLVSCSGGRLSVDGDLAAAVASAEPGETLVLAEGEHEGPIVIDKPLTIVGRSGAAIVAGADLPAIDIIEADGVTLKNLVVIGGRSGVRITRSEGIVLDRLHIQGAGWHGIFARDAEITVRNCVITDLTAPLAQGVEIINSDRRPASRVEGCTVHGPVFEGLVAHVSHVTFADNEVFGSTERGIVITEMSDGRMEGNRVTDAVGSAFFCGDMSHCSVVDNKAWGVSAAGAGYRSAEGHGLVVHFHSRAYVDELDVSGIDGEEVLVMLDSHLEPVSMYP